MGVDRHSNLEPAAVSLTGSLPAAPGAPPDPVSFQAPTDRAEMKRASVHGVAATFASQGLRFILQFGAQIVLAHLLLPTQFGLVAMVAPVLSLVQVFNDLGLTQATVQRHTISHAELTNLFWINLGVSLVLAVLLAVAAPLVAMFYSEPRLVSLTIACGSLLVLSGAAAQQIALMNRRMRYTRLAVIDVACALMAFLSGVAAALAGCGAWSLVIMQAANSATILVLAWALSDWRPSLPARGTQVWPLLRFGGHLTGFNFLSYTESNLATVLIGRFNGPIPLGLWDRGFKLVIVPMWQISLPVNRVAISLLSRLHGSDPQYARAFRQMLQGLLLVSAPGLIWAAFEAHSLVPMVLGRTWTQAAPMVAWLSLGTVMLPFGSAAYWLFVSQNRVAEQLKFGAISGVLLLTSILAGIHWGALGVARSYALFAPAVQGVMLWAATRRGIITGTATLKALYPIALAVSAAAGTLLLLQGQTGSGALAMGVDLLAAYAATGLALLCFPAGQQILSDVWSLRGVMRSV